MSGNTCNQDYLCPQGSRRTDSPSHARAEERQWLVGVRKAEIQRKEGSIGEGFPGGGIRLD